MTLARSLLALLLGAAWVAVSAKTSSPGAIAPQLEGAWVVPSLTQESDTERTIREAMRPDFADATSRIMALREVASSVAGTETSGLARVGAGLLLRDAGRTDEAITELSHADVGRTALAEEALLAIGQAHEEQESHDAAAAAYEAALAFAPRPTVTCRALSGVARCREAAGKARDSIAAYERLQNACPPEKPSSLLEIGRLCLVLGEKQKAALALDALVHGWPTHRAALAAGRLLARVEPNLPPRPRPEVIARSLARASALVAARLSSEALDVLRRPTLDRLDGEDLDRQRILLGRALLGKRKLRDAERALSAIGPTSPMAAEAALWLARVRDRRSTNPAWFEDVAARHAGTPFAEEALLAVANHHTAAFRHAEALSSWRRIATSYPEGRLADRATWRVAWADYRSGLFERAASAMEQMIAKRPDSPWAPHFLYWSGRARLALGESERGRARLGTAVSRFRNTWHGQRALQILGSEAHPPVAPPQPPAEPVLPAEARRVVRQLLLLHRLAEAAAELRALPPSRVTRSTLAWVESRRGRFRPAIALMRQAYPEHVSIPLDELPPDVQRILFPIAHLELIRTLSAERGLDPALIAALVCQESTFDAGAVSPAGARGLMQIMPATGRTIARERGVRFDQRRLFEPAISMDFGTYYLKQALDTSEGSVEKALAAYNAGPHRVRAWTAADPEMDLEEFVEEIPFTETRIYVTTILASREQYRRIYGLYPTPSPTSATGDIR